jgi:hypothetical protein
MRKTRIAAAVGAAAVVGGVLAAASVIPPGNDGPRLPAGQHAVQAASSDPNVMYHSGPNILADSSSPPVMYHS